MLRVILFIDFYVVHLQKLIQKLYHNTEQGVDTIHHVALHIKYSSTIPKITAMISLAHLRVWAITNVK